MKLQGVVCVILSTEKKWRINGIEIKLAECHAGLLQER